MGPVKILITDDHSLLAEGIAALLRPHYQVVGTAADGRQMLAQAEALRPDLITLDIGMPGLNGLEAAKQVRKLLPRVKLVFVTQQLDLRYLQAAFGAGASAYVAKQSASSELLAAVAQALAGRRYVTPLLEEALSTLAPLHCTPETATGAGSLTGRQREVLQLIAEGHSNRGIAGLLGISVKTVEFHRDALMRTLGLRSTAELIRYALAEGIAGG